MTRFTASENQAATEQPHIPYVMFADFDFPSGHVRANSGARSYTFGGNTYEPLGKLAGIGPVKESADLSPEKLEFTLSGVDNSLVLTTLGEKYHGRSANLYVGYCNDQGDLVTTPALLWEGDMDVMSIRTEESSSVIGLVCENRLVLWSTASGWLYSHEHQRILFPSAGDLFFNLVETLTDKVAKWGDKTVSPPSRGWGPTPPSEEWRSTPRKGWKF